MKKHPMLKYLKEEGPLGPRMPLIFCPGCGSGQVLNYTLHAVDKVIEEDKARKEDFLFISGIGCSGRITSHYLNFDSAWTIHGRAPAVATGALLANPAFKIIVFTGDGDAGSIGGNHFIHACRRNIDVTILCLNNGLYGMTGGQHAPTTPIGTITTTTPYRNREAAFDLCKLAEIAGASIQLDGTFADSLDAGGAVIFLRGHVMGPVMLSGADVYIEEGAIIEDTLRYSAGRLHIAEGAVLKSGIREIIPEPEEEPEVEKERPKRTFGGWFVRFILRFLLLAGAGLFLSLVLPRHFKDVTGRILVNPGLSALTGGLALVALPLVVFLVVLLFVSIVGIGAGLFFVALYTIGLFFSALYAGTALGRLILSKAKKGKEAHIVLSMLLGTFIAVVLCRIPFAGWLFRLGSFIFGFGALLISLWLAIRPATKLKASK